jgi:hypothetical protein
MATKAMASKAVKLNSEPKAKKTARAAEKSEGRIVETAQEARAGEPGPSVLALLTISTVAAGFVLGIIWFIFFRT